jgi:hypothetical protein
MKLKFSNKNAHKFGGYGEVAIFHRSQNITAFDFGFRPYVVNATAIRHGEYCNNIKKGVWYLPNHERGTR